MKHLLLEDVSGIVRLLGELAVQPTDVAAKRRRLVDGLGQLAGADAWVWAATQNAGVHEPPVTYFRLDGGVRSDPARDLLLLQASQAPERAVFVGAFVEQFRASGGHLTRSRAQVLADEPWYASGFYRRFLEPLGLDDFLFSAYHVGGKTLSALALYRRRGEAPFGPRELAIVHVVTGEVDWLHRAGTDLPAAADAVVLSPRQREVLLLLLAGDASKQIAQKLSLSVHTIGDYVKVLYKHFGVNSRGELFAKFLTGGAGDPGDGGAGR